MIPHGPGVLYAAELGGAEATPDRVSSETRSDTVPSWVHLCASHEATSGYLMLDAKLDEVVVEALLAKETRSRTAIRPTGALIIIKAMHRLEGASPNDMVGLRLWVDENRVITTRERDIDAIEGMKLLVKGRTGPQTSGEFLTKLFEKIYADIEPHIEELEDSIADLDEQVSRGEIKQACSSLAETGHSAVVFLRHLSPQKNVLDTLIGSGIHFLSARDVERLMESRDQLTRLLESLHEVRDRGAIINEQIIRIQDIELNRAVYKFSLAATVFLPLSFLTGLFGVNLGGLPGMRNEGAFWMFSGVCVLFLAFSILVSKKRRLF